MVSTGPLTGTRVVDLTRFVSGAYTTMLLASLGAEVVKIEVPPDGDPYRGQGAERVGDESALFLCLNNGKRSLAIDFRVPACRDALERLLAGSDFFVHNARPGSLDAHGLGAAAVRQRHPHLVYGSISGYGDVGPDADRGGFDLILQAEGGMMSVTGAPGVGPVKVGAPLLDIGAALSVAVGLLGAHIEKLRTGEGREVASSLLEFSVAGMTTLAAALFVSGEVPPLLGSHSPTFAPYGAFRARDDWLVLTGAGNERFWHRVCEVLDLDGLVDDPRFASNALRVAHRDELTAIIEAALAHDDADPWIERLEAAGIPAGRVRDLGRVLDSAQVGALAAVETVAHPVAGEYRTVGPPLRLDGERPTLGPAPVLGADTRSVLASVGVDHGTIDWWVAEGWAVAP
jgi:crotonobetainyl-CoA:carnitine CoA-transferase CaiB-like acyl-CoA transferase